MALGTGMFAGLALIVIVIAGVKIAFSGNIQPWELVRLVVGIMDSVGDDAVLHDHDSRHEPHLSGEELPRGGTFYTKCC